jgi:integrase
MSANALLLLSWIQAELIVSFKFRDGDKLFPMTKNAFKRSWSEVVGRAGIRDLHFHDLRREAGSRFDEAGLTRGEHNLMMGHANDDMSSLYHADLKSIQDKLDRYRFKGRTLGEVLVEESKEPGAKERKATNKRMRPKV